VSMTAISGPHELNIYTWTHHRHGRSISDIGALLLLKGGVRKSDQATSVNKMWYDPYIMLLSEMELFQSRITVSMGRSSTH
jgi:hypothetical protein